MGHRLSKIYTRTGDAGETGLGDGQRIAKDSHRVDAYGTIDELNSCLGVVLSDNSIPDLQRSLLVRIQNELFDLGGELCIPGHEVITQAHVDYLEQKLDLLNEDLPKLKEFILPGGGFAASSCHLARTICRRAERILVTVMRDETINTHSLKYLNRLSDLLFVIARSLSYAAGEKEVLWQHER